MVGLEQLLVVAQCLLACDVELASAFSCRVGGSHGNDEQGEDKQDEGCHPSQPGAQRVVAVLFDEAEIVARLDHSLAEKAEVLAAVADGVIALSVFIYQAVLGLRERVGVLADGLIPVGGIDGAPVQQPAQLAALHLAVRHDGSLLSVHGI